MENKVNLMTEGDLLNKITCGNNFAYIVNDNSAFLPTEYKVLQSQAEGSFIKCMKLLYNGKVQLYYLTNGYKSLLSILSSLDAENFIAIIANLFADIISVKNNGFLSCQNIDLSPEHIFVESSTYKIRLVYLPIGKRLFDDISAFENELRTSLINCIQNIPSLSSPKTIQLAADLSNAMLTLEEIYSKIKGTTAVDKKRTAEHISEVSSNILNMKLIAINAPVPFEIVITKDEFTLGKKQELVDGVISFNRMISRSHCKITRQGRQFAITDLNSANGTYVNRVRLQPEQPCTIKNGDVVRLANSEFKVRIE